jgi:hypothetical protein
MGATDFERKRAPDFARSRATWFRAMGARRFSPNRGHLELAVTPRIVSPGRGAVADRRTDVLDVRELIRKVGLGDGVRPEARDMGGKPQDGDDVTVHRLPPLDRVDRTFHSLDGTTHA